MRLILMWPSPQKEVSLLIAELEKEGHEVVYFVGENTEDCNPKGSIYHDHYDAWDGAPAPSLLSERILPVTRKVLSKQYELESLILTMMNKRYDIASVEARKHVYHEMLAYWTYVFDTLKPDGIIFQIIPHSVYNYIAFQIARDRGLFTYMFEEAVVGERLMYYRDFWHGSDELRGRLKQYTAKSVCLEELDPKVQEYWHVHRQDSTPRPWYVSELQKKASGSGLWQIRVRALLKGVRNGTIFSLIFSFIKKRFAASARREYLRVVQPFDISKPYVYYPLQFQPERTTSPQADVYHDQLLTIEVLSAALPKGWQIIVKEHPSQWFIRHKTRYNSVRWRGYYEHIANIPNVHLVPVDTDSFKLIDSAEAVAVATGTAGWEALLRGKKALVFGTVWYRDCPGVHLVESVDDCKHAFAGNTIPRDEEILAFLKAYEDASVRTHINQPADGPDAISPKEGTRVMTDLILREISAFLKEQKKIDPRANAR